MVRLRNREVQSSARHAPASKSNIDASDPLQLYQRYIHTVQMNPKSRGTPPNGTMKDEPLTGKRSVIQRQMIPLRQPGSAMDMKRTKAIRVRSKPSVDLPTSRVKHRPKTASLKNKPVQRLEDYESPADKKVSFEADEIECFFDALKETVEEVIQSKLSNIVTTVVETLTTKIDELSNKSQRIEGALADLCEELNSNLSHYGEEHSRHFRYICMKLEYDKIFYQHMNNLIHPEGKMSKNTQQSNEHLPQQESQQSNQTFASASQHASPINQIPDIFGAIPTCYHNSHQQSTRMPAPQQLPPGWSHQAGDSDLNSHLTQISQTARQFSHSTSGPFQRVVACQTSRSCPKQINNVAASIPDGQNEDTMPDKRVGQSKSGDVAHVSSENKKAQLDIKKFIDSLKFFQSNWTGRDTLIQAKSETPEEVKQLKQNFTLSPMDTDDSSSESVISNAVSILSSGEDSTQCAENTS